MPRLLLWASALRAGHTMERLHRNAFILIEAEANVVCLDALYSFLLLTIVESCYVARLVLEPFFTV